jgi:hypothetical protein
MPMQSSNFPQATSARISGRDRLARGGKPEKHSLTVVVPMGGALAQAAAPRVHPAVALAQEVQTTVAQVQDLMRRLHSLPGVNQQMFQQGAQLMLQGFQLIGASMPKPRQ